MTINASAKFEIIRFDERSNYILWQSMFKDMLSQQSLQKVLCETKSNNMDAIDWVDMKEKSASLIHLCVLDDVMYQVLDPTTPKEV